jgi:uncharacterized protein (DUF488 family)
VNTGWRNAAFRGYADHMASDEFAGGLDDLLMAAHGLRTAVMCAEVLWWRCHRRLISDVLVLLHQVPVHHLWHDGHRTEHVPAAGARITPEGLRYDDPDLVSSGP